MSEASTSSSPAKIPHDKANDYGKMGADTRLKFATVPTGASLDHVGRYSIDPSVLPGNVENLYGVAQVPMGLAGLLLVNGDHAQGHFYASPCERDPRWRLGVEPR
jgi:hydroxymethylglutaryl-CoA reductase (NADPH)